LEVCHWSTLVNVVYLYVSCLGVVLPTRFWFIFVYGELRAIVTKNVVVTSCERST